MPRKQTKQPKCTEPNLPILKLADVPGPEADGNVLKAHYQRVQTALATHCYDDVIQTCHWCLDMEAGLAYSKTDEARGTRMYCSGRCASAYSAYQVKALNIDRKVQPAQPPEDEEEGDQPEGTEAPSEPDDADEAEGIAPTIMADDADVRIDIEYGPHEDATRVRERAWHEAKASPKRKPRKQRVKDVTAVVGNEGTGKTTAHPARAKEPRANGKCARGTHLMTEANRYEYRGTIWCRECRKASRAKSANRSGK